MSETRLERGKYYVAEVSFREGNPVHMAIAYGQLTSGVVLWCYGYEEQIWTDVSKLSWFKIVTALPQMDCRPSRDMPPSKKDDVRSVSK
ncbi:hypothetical protein JCM15831A_14370 [Asaia astilbis]